mgnify:CR=1 FL=1
MQRTDARYLEDELVLRKQLGEVLQLKAVALVAQRLVVSDLLKHRDVGIGLPDVASHQLHPLVIPLEASLSRYEPGCRHGVPGVVRDDPELRMLRLRGAEDGTSIDCPVSREIDDTKLTLPM